MKKCKYLIPLFKHPSNKDVAIKGSIMDDSGLYACMIPEWADDEGGCVFDQSMANGCMNGKIGCECYDEQS